MLAAGSEAGLLGLAEVTLYGATKGWIHAFVKGVAVEQAKYGVRASAPGPSRPPGPTKRPGRWTRRWRRW